ncbi:MAG: hypothetical protein ACKO4R_08395, partial [Synechococcales cyanobacterium]
FSPKGKRGNGFNDQEDFPFSSLSTVPPQSFPWSDGDAPDCRHFDSLLDLRHLRWEMGTHTLARL